MSMLTPAETGIRYPEIEVQLSGEDGNAFRIIGRVAIELRRAGVTAQEIQAFKMEATAGDYDHVLATAQAWVTVL